MQALTEHVLKVRLAGRGARVPHGRLATAPDGAHAAATELGGRAVVKSMVARKDRAAAGLVRLVATADEARAAAAGMLAAEPGAPLLVEEIAPAGAEHYLALGFDLVAGSAVVMHGPGGSGVEHRSAPPTQHLVPLGAPLPADVLPAELLPVARAMVDEFQALRAHVLEVNPVRVVDGTAWVLDAKAVLDPAAPLPAEAVPVGEPDPVEARLRAEAAALKGGTEVRFGCLTGADRGRRQPGRRGQLDRLRVRPGQLDQADPVRRAQQQQLLHRQRPHPGLDLGHRAGLPDGQPVLAEQLGGALLVQAALPAYPGRAGGEHEPQRARAVDHPRSVAPGRRDGPRAG